MTEQFAFNQEVILVAEDNDYNFEYIKIVLEKYSLTVLRAKTGHECIDLLDSNTDIKMILMDIQLPDLNGIDATIQIRKNSNIPIIAQTAYAYDSDKKKFINMGCTDYLSKPLSEERLIGMVKKYLRP